MKICILSLILLFWLGCKGQEAAKNKTNDVHVHIMSDSLVASWQALGIPFSHDNSYYSNIDSILSNNGAQAINLIGMAHIYGNPEFYQGDDVYQKVKQENNFLNAAAKKYPDKIIPYFSIDPLAEYALDEAQRCFEKLHMQGMKLHFSSSQVYLTEIEHLKKVKPIFNYAAINKIPIMLHLDNWHPKFGKTDVNILTDSILTQIPALNLTIAHLGTSGGFNEKTKKVINAFVELYETNKIPGKHNIHFDISAVALDKDSEGVSKLKDDEFIALNLYLHKLGLDKIVFGTDYPLYEADEYLTILKERVKLTDEELDVILSN